MILGLAISVGAVQMMMSMDFTPRREIAPIVIEKPVLDDEDEMPELKEPIKIEPIETEPIRMIGRPGSPTNPIPVPKPVKPKLEVM